jgi:ribosomal protein L13E
MTDVMETLTIEELEALRDLNQKRLVGLHPDLRRTQVIRHNLNHIMVELTKRLTR